MRLPTYCDDLIVEIDPLQLFRIPRVLDQLENSEQLVPPTLSCFLGLRHGSTVGQAVERYRTMIAPRPPKPGRAASAVARLRLNEDQDE